MGSDSKSYTLAVSMFRIEVVAITGAPRTVSKDQSELI